MAAGSIGSFPVAAALGLLLLLDVSPPPPCAAARPLSSPSWSALALAPSASDKAAGAPRWRAVDAAAGKWLPYFAGAAPRYPGLWGIRAAPWAAGGSSPRELALRMGGELIGDAAPREEAAARQEEAAMWASLLNPTQVRTSVAGEAAPADAEGMDVVDEPAAGGGGNMLVGQPKWPVSP